MVIDLYGLAEDEVRTRFPKLYQHVLTFVKPDRAGNRDPALRERWWLFRRSNDDERRFGSPALQEFSAADAEDILLKTIILKSGPLFHVLYCVANLLNIGVSEKSDGNVIAYVILNS